MSLSDISIRRSVFAWMLMAGLIIFGTIAFMRLGVSQMPDVDFPVVNVSLSLMGAAPEVMENQIVDIVEDAIMGAEGIRSITSSSGQGSASVTVEFELEKDIDIAVQEVQNRVAQVQGALPSDLDPPVIKKTNPEDQPIVWMVLVNEKNVPMNEQMAYARNVLLDQFTSVNGIGDIILGGYVDPALRVWVSNDRLKAAELTVMDLISSIRSNHQDVPAGRIENDKKEYAVRFMGEAPTPAEFGHMAVMSRGGGVNFKSTPLSKFARIDDGLADIRRIARYNKKPVVALGILKKHGSNAIEVVSRIRAQMKEVAKTLPAEYSLAIRSDSTKFIKESVDALNIALLASALLTSLVCLFFLGSWSSTFNVLLSIPTSIVGTFIVIYFFGFTLNTFTLLGLSLAIGIVVDDAIMMLENITRHLTMGKTRKRAAIEGANEISFAAIAATVAVVAIFMPVVFMKGVIGRYFYQYGITVTAAVLLSLLEALTLTPMRCSQFLELPGRQGRLSRAIHALLGGLERFYSFVLRFALNHRLIMVIAALSAFGFSLTLISKIPKELVPAQDQSQFLLRLKSPPGSSLDFTNSKLKEIENILEKHPEVEGNFASIGGFGGDSVAQGSIFVNLVPPGKRKFSQAEIMKKISEEIKEKVKGMRAFAQDMSLKGLTTSRGYPVEFNVEGPDWAELGKITTEFMAKVDATKITTDLNTDFDKKVQEIKLVPRREETSKYNVSLDTVAQTVNALMGGAIMGPQVRYLKNGHRYNINVRLEASERTRSEQLNNVFVRNNSGEFVALSQITEVVEGPALQSITRHNRERAIAVYGNVNVGHSQEEVLKKIEKLGQETLPSGYHLTMTGSAKSFAETMQSLFFALFLGIIVSYMVLASQFNSFLHPVTVILALPFSIMGAFYALYITHQSINMYSMIGLILLMGIVKKNSILLVEFAEHLRLTGVSAKEAMLQAGVVRLRPILMTSVATIAAAVPEAIHFGPGSETRVPMAIAVIGGVLVSTVLTLIVVPCFYSLASTFLKTPVAEDEG